MLAYVKLEMLTELIHNSEASSAQSEARVEQSFDELVCAKRSCARRCAMVL